MSDPKNANMNQQEQPKQEENKNQNHEEKEKTENKNEAQEEKLASQNNILNNSQNLETSQVIESKPNEHSAAYKETLKKLKKIKQEINEAKNANATIREELKAYNNDLTHELEKTKFKKVEQETEEKKKETEKTVLEKEILTAKKQIESYNKQLLKLKDRLDPVQLLEKIKAVEEAIKSKKETIENQKIEIKNLAKLVRAAENQIHTLSSETDYSKHISILSIESKAAREKLSQVQTRNNLDEKNFKKQQEFITKLETKCAEISPKLKEPIQIEAIKALVLKEYEARENAAVKINAEKKSQIKLRNTEKKERKEYIPTTTKPNIRGSSVVKSYMEETEEELSVFFSEQV